MQHKKGGPSNPGLPYIFNIDKKSTLSEKVDMPIFFQWQYRQKVYNYRKKSIWRYFFNGNIGRLKYRKKKNDIPKYRRSFTIM